MQETRHGRGKANFHHAPGHGAHFGNFRQVQPKAGPIQRCDRADQRLAHGLRSQPRAIGQIKFGDAEDIAAPVVGHDPAFGNAGHYLALCIQAHQPLPLRRAGGLPSWTQLQSGFKQIIPRRDKGHIDHAIIPAPVTRGEGKGKTGSKEDAHSAGPSTPCAARKPAYQTLRIFQPLSR